MPTVKATFGGGIPLVDLDQGSPIPCCFVFELGHELTPTHITDRFCKAMIFDHVLDCQALDADRLVFTYQPCRELMQEVTTPISNARMDFRNFYACLGTILRTFSFLRVSPLCLCQLLLILVEELGIANHFTRREDDELFQAQVSPYTLLYGVKLLDILFYQDGDKVALSFIFRDGDAAWLASVRQWAVPRDVKRGIHFS